MKKKITKTKLKLPQPSPCEDLEIGSLLTVHYICENCKETGVITVIVPDNLSKLQDRIARESMMDHSMHNLLCEKESVILHSFEPVNSVNS